jgi:hypothetical protein
MIGRMLCRKTARERVRRHLIVIRKSSYSHVLNADQAIEQDQANENGRCSEAKETVLLGGGSNVSASSIFLGQIKSAQTLSSISSWNAIFQHLHELHSEQKYIEILEIGLETLSKGKNAPFPLYVAVLKALLAEMKNSSGNENSIIDLYETAYFLMEEMCTLNYKIPDVLIKTLAENIILTGDTFTQYRFQLLVQTMIANGAVPLKFLSHIIPMYISSGEIDGLLNFIRQVNSDNPSKSLAIPYALNEAMLLALIRVGDTHFALEVIKYLEALGPVYSRTWGLFVSHAARMRDHEAVSYAWKNALITGSVVVDDATYKMILDLAAQAGHVALAKWAFLRLRRRNELLGFEDDYNNVVLLFGRMIEAYANQPLEKEDKTSSIVHALSLISRMRHEAAMLKLKDLPSLVRSLSQSSNLKQHLERIRKLLDEGEVVKEVKTLLLNITLAAVVEKTRQPRQLLLICEFFNSQYDVIPNDDTILCLLQKAYVEKDGHLLYEVLNYKEKFGIIDNRRILETIVLAMRELGNYEDSEVFMSRLQELGTVRSYMREKQDPDTAVHK